MTGIA